MKNKKIAAVLAGAFFAGALNMPCTLAADAKNEKYPSFYEDFESYNVGDVPSYISKDAAFTAKVISNNGNKVLEIKYDRSANYANFNINLGSTFSKGMYNYSYKAKIVNSNQGDWYFPFMTLQTSSGEIFTSKIAQYGWQLMNASWMNFGTMKQFLDNDGYYNINRRIDLDNGKHYVQQNTSGAWSEQGLSKTAFSTINIRGIYGSNDGFTATQAKINDEENKDYAVIYIDDIVIEPDVLKMTDKNVSDKEDFSVSKNPEFTFNENIKAIDKTKIEIKETKNVWENNTLKNITETISTEKFDAVANGAKLTVSFANGLDYAAKYELTFKEGAITPTSKMATVYDTVAFNTESISEDLKEIKDGEIYTADLTTKKYTLNLTLQENLKAYISKDNGEYAEFQSPQDLDEGKYALVTVAEKDQKQEVKKYAFEVIIAKAPYAEDVKIEGEMYVGNTINGKYVFKDDNITDKEAVTEFRWKRLNKETGKYEYIKSGDELYTEQSYTLTEEDIGTSLKFAVIPVSNNEPNQKEEFESESYQGPAKPTAENVVLNKKEDGTFELTFEYKDINGFAAGEHIYAWYRAKDNNSEKQKIDGADKNTYTLTEDDVDCYIFASVIPKKIKQPSAGEEYFAKEAMTGYFRPTAKNILLTGKAVVGNVIGVNYVFSDLNDDIEGETEITWYVAGKEISEKGRSLELTSSMEGKEVYCEIIPVSTQYPYKGESVKSETVKISKKSGGGSISVSGGGGSSYVPSVPENKDDINSENKQEVFGDISGHWAEENIKNAYSKGIINGVSEKEFAPNQIITRAEIAAIIVRCLNITADAGASYADVSENDWFYDAVAAVSEKGCMSGFGGYFRPNDNLKREEFAAIAARLSSAEPQDKSLNFNDSEEISEWAREDVEKAVNAGIMQGRENNNFAPKENVTRAEAVTVMLRILENAEV